MAAVRVRIDRFYFDSSSLVISSALSNNLSHSDIGKVMPFLPGTMGLPGSFS